MPNNIKTLNNYLLNRKSCPKCFKNNIVSFSSPGRMAPTFNKPVYLIVKSMNDNRQFHTITNRKIIFYRKRSVAIKGISHGAYDMIEIFCPNCYYECDVYISNSIEK